MNTPDAVGRGLSGNGHSSDNRSKHAQRRVHRPSVTRGHLKNRLGIGPSGRQGPGGATKRLASGVIGFAAVFRDDSDASPIKARA